MRPTDIKEIRCAPNGRHCRATNTSARKETNKTAGARLGRKQRTRTRGYKHEENRELTVETGEKGALEGVMNSDLVKASAFKGMARM
jgi:hypothetical protein